MSLAMSDDDSVELITIGEAAKRARLPRSTLRNWLRDGVIPVERIRYGSQYRVRVDQLDAWLAVFWANRHDQ